MTTPLLFIDGDDTLWGTETLYQAARSDVAAYLASLAPGDTTTWWHTQAELDLDLRRTLGLSPQRFPLSCVRAAQRWAAEVGVRWNRTHEQAVRCRAEGVFSRTAVVDPNARRVLEHLAAGADLVLLTQGHPDVQRRRVDDSRLATLFRRVIIVPRKSEFVFAALALDLTGSTSAAVSVGNSSRSDIAPALAAGLSAVWLHKAPGWAGEHAPVKPVPRLATADNLAAVPAALESLRAKVTPG